MNGDSFFNLNIYRNSFQRTLLSSALPFCIFDLGGCLVARNLCESYSVLCNISIEDVKCFLTPSYMGNGQKHKKNWRVLSLAHIGHHCLT